MLSLNYKKISTFVTSTKRSNLLLPTLNKKGISNSPKLRAFSYNSLKSMKATSNFKLRTNKSSFIEKYLATSKL